MRFVKSLLIGIAISCLIFLLGFSFLGGLGFGALIAAVPVLILCLILTTLILVGSIIYGMRYQNNKITPSEQIIIKRVILVILALCAILFIIVNIRVFTIILPNIIHRPIAESQLKKEIYLLPTYVPPGVQYRTASFYKPGNFPSYFINYNCNRDPNGLVIHQYFTGNPDYQRDPVSKMSNGSKISINGLEGFYEETWFSNDLLIDAVNNLRIDLHIYDKNKCNLQNPKEELIKMAQSMKHQ